MEKEIRLSDSQYDYVRDNLDKLDNDMGSFLREMPGDKAQLLNWLLLAEIDFVSPVTDYSGLSFADSGITVAKINPAVTEIPANMFKNTKITEVAIPASVKSIGSNAFNGCKKLKKVVMTNNVDSVGSGAFANWTNLAECYFTNAWTRSNSTLGVFTGDDKVQIKIVQPGKERTIEYSDKDNGNLQTEKFADKAAANARIDELVGQGYSKDDLTIRGGLGVKPDEMDYYKDHKVWITQQELDAANAGTKTEAVEEEKPLEEKASIKAKDALDGNGNFIDKVNAEVAEEDSFKESLSGNADPFDILNNFDVD